MARARLSLGGLLAGCAWALASAGQAQQAPAYGAAPAFGATPGVGAGGPPLSVTLGSTGVYDTNVAQGNATVAKQRHLPSLSDAYVTPSAALDVNKALGPEQVFLHALYSYSFYARDTALNHQHLDVQGGGQGRLASCEAQLTGAYSRFQSDLAELSVRTANNTAELEQVTLNASCPRSIGISPQFSVSESWRTNDTRSLSTSDYRSFMSQGGLAYARPVFGLVSLNGQYSETVFPNRLLPGEAQDGYRMYGGGLHFERSVGARLRGAVTANYIKLDLEGAQGASAGQGFSGPSYTVDLTYSANSRLTAHVLAERDTRPSYALNAAYVLFQGETEEVNYQLNSRLILTAGARQVDDSYRGSLLANGPGPQFLVRDDRHEYYANGALTLNSRLSLSLEVRDELRHAAPAEFDYHSLRTSLRLSATF